MVAQRPRPHGLADDRDLVAVLLLEDADGIQHAPRIGVGQEIIGDADVVGVRPDGLAHAHRGPVVLLLPLDFAPERRGFLNDREHRHDRIEAELGVAGGRKPGHQFGIAVGLGKMRVDQIHQLDGGDRGRVTDRGAVHRLAPECPQDTLAAGQIRDGLGRFGHVLSLRGDGFTLFARWARPGRRGSPPSPARASPPLR